MSLDDDPAFVVTRSDSDRTLPVALRDVEPQVTDHLRSQVNDFIAAIIGSTGEKSYPPPRSTSGQGTPARATATAELELDPPEM